MRYFCNGKKGFCDHDNECQSTCEFFDGRGGYYAEVVTNADRIRAMSDEELVDAMMVFLVKSVENSDLADLRVEFADGYRDALLRELRQPAKDGDNK